MQNMNNIRKRLKKIGLKSLVFILVLIGVFLVIYLIIFLGALFYHAPYTNLQIPPYTYIDKKEEIKGEPINILIIGIDIEKENLFEQLGWTKLEGFWEEGAKKAISDLTQDITPISSRYQFGRVQDIAYQGEGSTVLHRHHIRLWKEKGANDEIIYYATASYDQTVGITPLSLWSKPTHLIAPNIDTERDFIGGLIAEKTNAFTIYADSILPALFKSNGDNAWYYTDGKILVISKNPLPTININLEKLRKIYFGTITYILKLIGIAK